MNRGRPKKDFGDLSETQRYERTKEIRKKLKKKRNKMICDLAERGLSTYEIMRNLIDWFGAEKVGYGDYKVFKEFDGYSFPVLIIPKEKRIRQILKENNKCVNRNIPYDSYPD